MKFVSDLYLRQQTVAFAIVLLGGCATAQQPNRPTELTSMNLDVAARIATAAPGSVLSVPVDKGRAAVKGTVGETYYAASNRECKRFVPLDMKGQTERVVCMHSSGIWYMQRALPVRGTAVKTQPLSSLLDVPNAPSIVQVPAADVTVDDSVYVEEDIPETTSNLTVEPVQVDIGTQVFNVESGETLLKFSQRVTGTRKNWMKIALRNNIEEPYILSVGMPLQVPVPEARPRANQSFSDIAEGLKVQGRVISALILRDAQTRYGQHKLGFVWLFLEPVLMVILFILWKVFIRDAGSAGMHDAYFITTGIVPFLLFRQVMQSMSGAISSSRSLLLFPQVTTFDVLISVFLLEIATSLFVFGSLTAAIAIIDVPPRIDNPLLVLYGTMLLAVTGAGAGLIFGSLSPLYPSIRTITNPLLGRPLFFTSGVFFTAEMIPSEIREYLLINPLLHMIEIVRSAFFIEFESRYIDWHYATLFATTLFCVGLLCHQVFRNEVLKQGWG